MTQKNLNSLSILYESKSILDDISIFHVANEFVEHQPDRENTLGSFTAKDL